MSRSGRHIRVLLQSRLGSSRLPGKALLPVAGQPLAVLAARRAASRGHDVVVATSVEPTDDILASHLRAAGVNVVRGQLDDVLDRFVMATADLGDSDVAVRFTADNALPDGSLADEMVDGLDRALAAGGAPYVRVDGARAPNGLGAEACTVQALRAAGARATSPYDREHVMPWLRRELGESEVVPTGLPPDAVTLRCTVDVLDDYLRIAALFAAVDDPLAVPWQELLGRLASERGERVSVPVRDRSGLGQSALVLGTGRLGQPARRGDPRLDDSAARTVLRAAVAGGVTHVDTARSYGEREAAIRRASEPILTRRLGVVTRVAPLAAVADGQTARYATEASVERSLADLGNRRVDALLLHRAGDARVAGGAAWERLLAYAAEGVAGRIGVSVESTEELRTALELGGLGYLRLPFNVLTRHRADPALVDRLTDPNIVVTVVDVSPERVGTDDAGPLREPLERLARELGREGIADLCIAYVLGHPWVTSVVISAAGPQDVERDVRLVAREPLQPAECEAVRAAIAIGT